MLAACHRQSHAKEHRAELCSLHPNHQILQCLDGNPRFSNLRVTDRLVFDHCPQDCDQFEILSRPNL